jgi:hypothetical protein
MTYWLSSQNFVQLRKLFFLAYICGNVHEKEFMSQLLFKAWFHVNKFVMPIQWPRGLRRGP